jgi:cytochrome c-type biogenesis protein CcmF
MMLGTILLIGAILALILGIIATLTDIVRRGDRKPRELAVAAGWGAFALMGAALVLLAGAFLMADLSLQYVWENVKTHYTWFKRLSGLWVGRAGSMMLWSVFLIGFWCLEEARHRRAAGRSEEHAAASAHSAHHAPSLKDADQAILDTETIRRWARLTVYLVTLLFVIIVLYGRPFAPIDPNSLLAAPDGRGINPQLLIFYNAIHPPIVFLGYAATLLPTAFAVGHFLTGRPGWVGSARRWAHIAFVMLTIGVALGALWAYIALGWGGYWDWDPVEVASLIPWILVVAFLHAAYRNDGKGMFPVAAPFIGTLVFVGTLFSTLVVRSGVWVSLHSFIAAGDAQNAWSRYVNALEHPEVLLFSVMIFSFVALALISASLQAARIDSGLIETPQRQVPKARKQGPLADRILSHLDLHNLFIAGVLLLLLLATVTVTLLFVGINGFPSSGVREQIFTQRTGPVALTAVTVMAVAIGIGYLPRRAILGMLAGALLVGALAAFLLPDVWALALAVPVLAFAAAMAGLRVVHAWRRMPRKRAVRFAGIHLIHLGVAVLLLGHGIVTTFETTEDTVELRIGETRDAGPYQITLLGIDTEGGPGTSRVHHVTAHLLVTQDDGTERNATAGFQYFDFQSHYKPTVGVMRTLGSDIYLAPKGLHDPAQGWIFGNLPLPEQGKSEARSIDAVSFEVSTLPYINLVWGGTLLMILGGGALSASSWTIEPRRETRTHTTRESSPAPRAPAKSPATSGMQTEAAGPAASTPSPPPKTP